MEGRNASPYPGLGGPQARTNPQNPNVNHGIGMVGPTSHHGGVPMLNMPPTSRSPPPPNLINTSAPLVLNNAGGPVGQQPLQQFQAPLPISGPGHPIQPGQQPMMGGDLGLQPQPVPHPQPQSQPQLQFTTAPPQQQQQLLPTQPGTEPPPVGYPLSRPLRSNNANDVGFVGQPGGPPPLMQIPSQTTSIASGNGGAPALVSTPVGLQQQNIPTNKQRVFTGAVTKLLDSFGFVDDDVFFQFDVVKGSQPQVGEKVLVEASFSPNMPFKWNANRVQVLPNQPATTSVRNETADPPFDPAFQQQQQQPPPPPQQQQQPPQFSGPQLGGGLLPPPVVAQPPPIVSHQVIDHQQLQQQQIQQQQHQIQQNQQHISAGIPPPNWIPNPPAPAPLMQIETAPVIPKDPPPKDTAVTKPVHLPPRLRVGARGVLTPTTADRKRTQASLKSEGRSGKSKDRDSSPDSSEESSRRGESRQKESISRDSSPGEEGGSVEKAPSEGGPAKESVVEERKIRTRASRQLGRPPPRYYVRIPKLSTLSQSADLVALRSRYPNLYIPSDFFVAHLACNSAFDVQHPFPLVQSNPPLSFHVLSKEDCCRLRGKHETPSTAGSGAAGTKEAPVVAASIDPPDATRKFVAKVMLLSFPAFKEFCRKTIFYPGMPATAEGEEDVEEKELLYPSKCFQFLIGTKGRSESMAIGGSWSEKEDGPYPDSDPKVLVHTAIRTTKALTGIDLSSCTRWYKFLEVHYFRPEVVLSSSTGVKVIPARTETVVMFLPDVWNWTLDEKIWEAEKEAWMRNKAVVLGEVSGEAAKEEEAVVEEVKPVLDPKKMKVDELRAELKRRSISDQGLKSQLIARLHKALKADLEKSAKDSEAIASQKKALGLPEVTPEKKEESEPPAEVEAEKPLPKFFDKPKILAYPNRAAKSGKFDCSVRSLHSLLGYKSDDLKESTFEISLFAELFHERIMRDQGFKIFQSISSISDEKAAAQREREKEYQRHRGEPPAKKTKSESPNRVSKEREEDEEGEKEEEEEEESEALVPKKAPKVPDAHLVFAFTYFDVNRCGYLEQKDIEDLFSILGLHLSRSQIRRILSRVTTRDYISYTKTCFLEAAGLDSEEALISHERTLWPEEKIGNRMQLAKLKGLAVYGAAKIGRKGEKIDAKSTDFSPATTTTMVSPTVGHAGSSSMVNYRGQPLDLDKLFTDISKSEAGRLSFRDKLKSLESVLGGIKDDESQLLKDETENQNKIGFLRHEIRTGKQEIGDVKSKVAIFQDALRAQQRALETNVGEMTKIIDEQKSKEEEAAKVKVDESTSETELRPVNGGDEKA